MIEINSVQAHITEYDKYGMICGFEDDGPPVTHTYITHRRISAIRI